MENPGFIFGGVLNIILIIIFAILYIYLYSRKELTIKMNI